MVFSESAATSGVPRKMTRFLAEPDDSLEAVEYSATTAADGLLHDGLRVGWCDDDNDVMAITASAEQRTQGDPRRLDRPIRAATLGKDRTW